MSVEALNQFLQKANEDEQLAQEIANVLESENDTEAVIELAQIKGYQFTAKELLAEVHKRQHQKELEELSEEELEAVAGGLCIVCSVKVPTTAGFRPPVEIKW